MSNELTKTDNNKIALMSKQELSDIIKPLKQEIHLFDTFIAGLLSLKNPNEIKKLKIGDKLILKREDCLFDEYRIAIFNEADIKIGYIPEKDNTIFAKLLDAGKLLIGRIADIQTKHQTLVISIGIYLIDY